MRFNEFLNSKKGLLIAPAGHGKTHAIATCVKMSDDKHVQLILTHTHAGIASLRSKLNSLGVSKQKYIIETICGFAQKITFAYTPFVTIPEQTDKEYFKYVVNRATNLIDKKSVQNVLINSYHGVFIDEYQDCSIEQHKLIMKLAKLMPSHILGDELQGIYDFADKLVDFSRDLSDYNNFSFLNEPWRWECDGNCKELGQKILKCRKKLLTNQISFKLVHDKNAHFYVFQHDSDRTGKYYSAVRNLVEQVKDDSVLIILPTYYDNKNWLRGGIEDRAKFRKQSGLEYTFSLIEAIDDKSFYSISEDIDTFVTSVKRIHKKEKRLFEILAKFSFNKTALAEWIDHQNSNIKNKRGDNNPLSKDLKRRCEILFVDNTLKNFLPIIEFFTKKLKYRPKRPELLYSLIKSISMAIKNNNSVFNCMIEYKNIIRHTGRKIKGRCIGTTLLTKGLEFDTVIIVDAHLFTDKKNFYVAISRACKNLIILTEDINLTLN